MTESKKNDRRVCKLNKKCRRGGGVGSDDGNGVGAGDDDDDDNANANNTAAVDNQGDIPQSPLCHSASHIQD